MKSRLPGCLYLVILFASLGLTGALLYQRYQNQLASDPTPAPLPAPVASNDPTHIEAKVTGTLVLQSTSPAPLPTPGPDPTPPRPIPVPPKPETGPGGFVYPPDLPAIGASPKQPKSSFVDELASRIPAGSEAQSRALFYAFLAKKIENDGFRKPPGLTSLKRAIEFAKNERDAYLVAEGDLKTVSPEVEKLVGDQFQALVDDWRNRSGDKFTPDVRREYVAFLRNLQSGFESAGK